MKEPGIQYIGANELTPIERNTLDKLSTEYYPKIERMLKNMTSLVIHVKLHKLSGKGKREPEAKRKKIGIHIRALAPTRIFTSTKAFDWDLAKAVHKSFADLQNIIKKSMRPDEQRPKRVSKVWIRNL
ncbi:hypothetical protein HY488_02920 [Candidatus Woesearchaeota archaeon]|nr:hypothetical protein [Candidatus Woesearchaeota archaeon]